MSWLCGQGVNPTREARQEVVRGGGHPLKLHPLGHKKPKLTPQQGAVPGFELGVLPALVIASRTPPASPKGDMGTDGTRHCTTLPSVQ